MVDSDSFCTKTATMRDSPNVIQYLFNSSTTAGNYRKTHTKDILRYVLAIIKLNDFVNST